MGSARGPAGFGGGFDRLREVQAAAEQEIEKRLKLSSVLAGEALATQPDDVQPGDAIDALGAAVMGNVFAE